MQNQQKIFNAAKSSVISYKKDNNNNNNRHENNDNEIIDAIDASWGMGSLDRGYRVRNKDPQQHSLRIELIMASRLPYHAPISVKTKPTPPFRVVRYELSRKAKSSKQSRGQTRAEGGKMGGIPLPRNCFQGMWLPNDFKLRQRWETMRLYQTLYFHTLWSLETDKKGYNYFPMKYSVYSKWS